MNTHTLTLNELLTRKATDLTPSDLSLIITGLREQREQWNANQNSGVKKRVQSKNIEIGEKREKKAKPSKNAPATKHLMGLQL